MENKCFSINIPSTNLIPQVDAVGQVSGKEHDKSKIFDVFFGDNENAPMVKGSLIAIECELVDSVSLVEKDEKHPRAHTLFIGKVKNVWTNKDSVDENGLKFKGLEPILWTWSPMNYWTIGEKAGRSWNAENRKLVQKKKRK
jgi:flavin reductase (DIM6/NTAB) family NADH-FMN oxidoreductase RutF